MDTTSFLALLVGMALVTYATRSIPLLIPGVAGKLPVWLTSWLRFVPTALFAAVAVPAVARPALSEAWPLLHPYPWGAAAAALVARYTRNLALAMVTGMLVVLLWRVGLGWWTT